MIGEDLDQQFKPHGRITLPSGAVVTVATAHPAKFQKTVAQALGRFRSIWKAPTLPLQPDPLPPPNQDHTRAFLAQISMDGR